MEFVAKFWSAGIAGFGASVVALLFGAATIGVANPLTALFALGAFVSIFGLTFRHENRTRANRYASVNDN